ncbi:hypothetical protein PY479_10865 [Shewanella sp. A32]|uniref:hypothetical protein n=1 Tax=Shewanella sp. A32 TaxID=3031327 RepID=UPI0023B979FF|nr:hypothetical protein [Shewanella sp. A32]MDF0534774.1 hypothetical protein [Shewanella sp. A32]
MNGPLYRFLNSLSRRLYQRGWKLVAIGLVLILAGSDLLLLMELSTMLELLGASTFVLVYYSGFKLLLSSLFLRVKQFERHGVFFLPERAVIKSMPSMLIHALPNRCCWTLLMLSLATAGADFLSRALDCGLG